MNDTPTFIDKTIDNYNNELTKACLREQLLKEDCQDLERELTAARAELAEMTARAASLAAHLPPDTLCGDIQKWRDEYKMAIEQRDRLADLVKQFIYILDITEESDSGRLFHPTNITSCRAGDLQKIGELVEALRRASRTTNPNEQ